MDRISACRLIDPDHDEPPSGRSPANHLVGIALLEVGLDPPAVGQDFPYLVEGDSQIWMVLGQMLPVGGIPDDWPIVHPTSIYDTEVRTASELLHERAWTERIGAAGLGLPPLHVSETPFDFAVAHASVRGVGADV